MGAAHTRRAVLKGSAAGTGWPTWFGRQSKRTSAERGKCKSLARSGSGWPSGSVVAVSRSVEAARPITLRAGVAGEAVPSNVDDTLGTTSINQHEG